MSERGREEKKKIFPAGTVRALGGARLPVENIFFHILRFSEARIFPSAGKSALFPAVHLAKHCLAGKSALFPAVHLAKYCLAGKSALFPAEYLAQNCSAGKSALFPAVSVANGVFAGRVLVLRAVWPRWVRFSGMGDGYSSVGARWGGRAEYHKGRRFLALVTVKTYFCPSVYHLNYV